MSEYPRMQTETTSQAGERTLIKLGNKVRRLAHDYTNGREGRIIEIDNIKPRARVSWEKEKDGTPMKLRTWVRLQDLELLPD